MHCAYYTYVLCVLCVLYCYSIKVIVSILISELLYGGNYTLHCGGGGPAEWFHNDLSTGVNSNTYTITNANFSHNGEYQCRRNGVDALNPPLEVIVHGECSVQVKDVVDVHVCEYKCEWMQQTLCASEVIIQ